jgi:uncharacterized membrane protein YkvA (DUF1232 family)
MPELQDSNSGHWVEMLKQILPWIIAIVYFLLPFDLVPDMFLGPGWLDDLAMLGLAYWWYTRMKKLYAQRTTRSTNGFQTSSSGQPCQDQAYYQKNSQKDDPYSVLGIQPGATKEEIRKAYARLAVQYHPDKVQHLGEEFRKLAHEKFVAIQKAYDAIK